MMEKSEKEQSFMLGRSHAYIASLRYTNRKLYDHCTNNGRRLFITGYNELCSEYDTARCKVSPLIHYYKDSKDLRILDLFTKSMAKEFKYVSPISMKQAVLKRIWEVEPTNRVELLKLLKIFNQLISTHKDILDDLE